MDPSVPSSIYEWRRLSTWTSGSSQSGTPERSRVFSDEQAIDIVDRADGGDNSSLAEADRFVAEVHDFNFEALPRDDDGQAACRLTVVVLVEADVRRDQDLTSEVGCN